MFCVRKTTRQGTKFDGPWTQDACALLSVNRYQASGIRIAMARPRTSDKREKQLNLHLTNGEFDAITSCAYERGMHVVDFARGALVQIAKTGVIPATPETAHSTDGSTLPASRYDKLAIAQLQRLGNVLNQIARHMHTTGQLPLEPLVTLLDDIRAMLLRGL
jgi:hypothetical protein